MSVVRDAIKNAMEEMRINHRKEEYQKQFEKYDMEYQKKVKDSGVLTYFMKEDEYLGIAHEKGLKALISLDNIVCFPRKVSEEIKIYRKYVPELLNDYRRILDQRNMLLERAKRQSTDSEAKKYKRWTEEEDNELIEYVCDPELSILDVSVTMGRTVPAIKSRVSKLVGIKRLSQEVAGRFIGTINGNHAECVIDGTIYKKEDVI